MLLSGKHGQVLLSVPVFQGKQHFPEILFAGTDGIIRHVQHEGHTFVGKTGEEKDQQLEIFLVHPDFAVPDSLAVLADPRDNLVT